jgi:hypothetical protein
MRFPGQREKLTHFRSANTIHLQVEGKNEMTTCRPAEKFKLTDFKFHGGF